MIALAVPLILVALLVLAVVLLVKKKYKSAIVLAICIVILNWWSDCISFGFKNSFEGDLKVLSVNVNGSGVFDNDKLEFISSLISEENPDVLLLMENFTPFGDSLRLRLRGAYPYYTTDMLHHVIYSKTPVSNVKYDELPNKGTAFIVQCDVTINNQIVKVVGCHLSSNNYSKERNYLTPNKVGKLSDVVRYCRNFKGATHLRELEAESIVNDIGGKKKIVIMGDFNDVCGSGVLNIFHTAKLKDAWSKGGLGYGATINHPLPFRIDHVLYGEDLELNGIKIIETMQYSDHDVLVACFDILGENR